MRRTDLPSARAAQQGVALITALVITALIVIVSVAMASRQGLDVRRTANVLDGDRAYEFALGVESWGSRVLAHDRRDSTTDHPEEDWATVLPPLAVEGAVVAGKLEDLQGRFNLNNLVKDNKPSEIDLERYRRLLENLDIDPVLAEAVVDWIDADMEPLFPNGAEDSEYLRADPPHRAANRPMVSASELMLVQGYTKEIYDRLAPYVTALPERTEINVNTAPAEIIRCLGTGVTAEDAQAVNDGRGKSGYANLDDFMKHDALAGRGVKREELGLASRYFLLTAQTQFGARRLALYSVLARNDQGAVKTIMRSQGLY